MPVHSHQFGQATNFAAPDPANPPLGDPNTNTPGWMTTPKNCIWAKAPGGRNGSLQLYHPTPNASVNPLCMTLAGGGQPHNNLQPYLILNFCIALQGVFPPRG
jgi:microcystin-dependent protein